VTVVTRHRRPVFADPAVASGAVRILRERSTSTGVPVYAFCVMPDHAHLVVSASPSCGIVAFVGQYKNLVQREAWAHGVEGRLWQESFWDHFLRADEGLDGAVEYVLANPVRAGLARTWREYPFAGSLAWSL
jgi:REP element-mobilizing transposase RayT